MSPVPTDDFSMSLEYSYGADAAIADDATRVAVEEGSWKPGSIVYNVTDGDFAISKVVMESATGAWGPGATAKVVFLGESFVKLTAGTLRWKIYEAGMKYFVGQGSTPFFRCTNKGCDTAQGIALKLTQPKANKTSFQLITTFVMPKAQATGQFKVRTLCVHMRVEVCRLTRPTATRVLRTRSCSGAWIRSTIRTCSTQRLRTTLRLVQTLVPRLFTSRRT